MDSKAFRKTSRFLEGEKIKSLSGRLALAGIAAIKSPTVEVKVPKTGCKVFLVGGDGGSPSNWHKTEVVLLESDLSVVRGLKSALESHLSRIMTPEERRQAGLKAAAKLTVSEVVADDSRKVVFVRFKSNEMDIDEHGLTAIHEGGKWRLEDDSFVLGYLHDLLAFQSGPSTESGPDSEPVSLVGRWILDEEASAEHLRSEGMTPSWIRSALKMQRGTEWVFTDSQLIQKSATSQHEMKLLSVRARMGVIEVAVEIPGVPAPEVLKLKLADNRIFTGMVLRRES